MAGVRGDGGAFAWRRRRTIGASLTRPVVAQRRRSPEVSLFASVRLADAAMSTPLAVLPPVTKLLDADRAVMNRRFPQLSAGSRRRLPQCRCHCHTTRTLLSDQDSSTEIGNGMSSQRFRSRDEGRARRRRHGSRSTRAEMPTAQQLNSIARYGRVRPANDEATQAELPRSRPNAKRTTASPMSPLRQCGIKTLTAGCSRVIKHRPTFQWRDDIGTTSRRPVPCREHVVASRKTPRLSTDQGPEDRDQ